MLLERLHAILDAAKSRGRRSWGWLMFLLILALFQNRIYDWINRKIDASSPLVLQGFRDVSLWSSNDTLGMVGLLLAGTVIFILIAACVETRQARKLEEPPRGELESETPKDEQQAESLPPCPIEIENGVNYSEIGDYQGRHVGLMNQPSFLGGGKPISPHPHRRIYEIGIHNKALQTVRSVRVELESIKEIPDRDDEIAGLSASWGNLLKFESGGTCQDFTGDMRDKISLVSHSRAFGDADKIVIHCLNRTFVHRGHQHILNLKVTADGFQKEMAQFKVWIGREDGFLKVTRYDSSPLARILRDH